jgi:hypothetical protein
MLRLLGLVAILVAVGGVFVPGSVDANEPIELSADWAVFLWIEEPFEAQTGFPIVCVAWTEQHGLEISGALGCSTQGTGGCRAPFPRMVIPS